MNMKKRKKEHSKRRVQVVWSSEGMAWHGLVCQWLLLGVVRSQRDHKNEYYSKEFGVYF